MTLTRERPQICAAERTIGLLGPSLFIPAVWAVFFQVLKFTGPALSVHPLS